MCSVYWAVFLSIQAMSWLWQTPVLSDSTFFEGICLNAKIVWTLPYVPVRRRILLFLLFVVLWVTLFSVSTHLSVPEDNFCAQNFYRNQIIPLATLNPATTTSSALCFWTLKYIGKGVQMLMRHFSALAAASCLLVEKAVEQIEPGGTGLSILHK